MLQTLLTWCIVAYVLDQIEKTRCFPVYFWILQIFYWLVELSSIYFKLFPVSILLFLITTSNLPERARLLILIDKIVTYIWDTQRNNVASCKQIFNFYLHFCQTKKKCISVFYSACPLYGVCKAFVHGLDVDVFSVY